VIGSELTITENRSRQNSTLKDFIVANATRF